MKPYKKRTQKQKIKDFITFPLRAFLIFEDDKWTLSSLRTERFDYVASEVKGFCLDVGCGRNNVFITNCLAGDGRGIDVFPFEGLHKEQIIPDMNRFPFKDKTFTTVTFIANINHIPKTKRDPELKEAYRCLKFGGNIIVTMGNPFAETLVHKVVHHYDKVFHTNHDMDGERGMHDEEFYLKDEEIMNRLRKAGFTAITKKYFLTQWRLNHLFIGWKK